MRIQFASGRQQLPFSSSNVAVITGSLTTSKTLYFAFLGENPAGVNQLSPIVGGVAIGVGQGVSVTIPSTAHQPGEYFESYVLAASTTNTPSSFVQLAKLQARDSDGNPIALPATLTLDSDDHLALSATVATPDDLPTNPLHGMLRQVTSLGKIFEYDEDSLLEPNDSTVLEADIGAWVWHPGTFSAYVESTTEGGGCDRSLSQVTVTPLRAPRYTPDGATGTQRIFWIFNNDDVAYPAGNRVGLSLTLNDIPQDSRWNGLLAYRFLGYAKPSDGSLRITYSDSSSFPDVGVEKPYDSNKSDLILPDDLQPGEAYALAVYPAFTPAELNGEVPNNSVLRVAPFIFSQTGSYVDIAAALGSWIYPVDDRGWVVPQLGLTATALRRSGMVKSGLGGRSFLKVGPTPIVELQPDTADQLIAINGNGAVYLADEIQSGEALRAIVGTVDGTGQASAWSTAFSVNGSQGIRVTCTYPSNGTTATIRADYPDPIAGLSGKAKLNAPFVTVYVKSGSTIKRFTGLGVVDGATQQFDLDDWNAGTVIGSIPVSDGDFGLFEAVSATGSANAAGDFPSGSLQVAFAFEYDGSAITSISHKRTDGCILTPTADLSQVFDRSNYYAEAVADLDALRTLPLSGIHEMQARPVRSLIRVYYYDLTSTGEDDGTDTSKYVKPDAIDDLEPGRFVREDTNQWFVGYTAPDPEMGGLGDFFLNTSADDLYQKTGADTWTLLTNLRGSQWFTGSGEPSNSIGSVSDFYLNSANGQYFEKTGETEWISRGSLRGIAGPPGTVEAATGLVLVHSTEPSVATAQTALYVDEADGTLKLKIEAGDIIPIALPPQLSDGSPDGVLTSRWEKDLAIDFNVNTIYWAPTANSTAWNLIASGDGGGDGSGGDGSDAGVDLLLLNGASTPSITASQMALYFNIVTGSGRLRIRYQLDSGGAINDEVALLGKSQPFTAPQVFEAGHQDTAIQIGPDGSNLITPTLNDANSFYVEMYSNATLKLPTGSLASEYGVSFEILFYQLGSPAVLSFENIFSGYKFPGGTAPTLDSSYGAALKVKCRSFNGTWYCESCSYPP